MLTERLDDESLLADPAPLRPWFDALLGGRSLPITLTRVSGGASNSLFLVRRGECRYALRRPPATANDRTSHDFDRELRLARALATTDIPHARLVGGTTEPDWIGGPFIVLDWIDGFTPRDPMPAPFAEDRDLRRALGDSVIDALASIARVDWRAAGLDGFGRPDGFLARQVDRWLAQYARNQTRELAGLDALTDWLRTNTPPAATTGLMHGDYSFANVMIAPDRPARVAAVIDWELATIGDPLLDLGHLLSSWADDTTGPTWAHYVHWNRGFRSRAETAARYAERSGRPIDHLPFYMALALFRLAVILEGSFARYVRGQSDNPRHAAFEERVPSLIAQAMRTIERA
ncbi:phosphotransferase family protein [Sphingomonas sp. C8-2]|jgi:aminoglycoside phosphotransferase (APT) family kinase protein|nr:phosphotransferase family protein [Sphingomonas sp. C8-2]